MFLAFVTSASSTWPDFFSNMGGFMGLCVGMRYVKAGVLITKKNICLEKAYD